MTAPAISLRQVSKWYGPVIGLNQVSLELAPGITGLLGPNGAGKSTLLRLATGQLRPSMGEVSVFGRNVWRRSTIRRRIGYAPEVDAFYEEMTCRDFVRSMARLSGLTFEAARQRTETALEQTGMLTIANKRLRSCSKGMRQRVKLAQALVHDPDVLVLDEPLSGIDPNGRRETLKLFEALRDQGKTLLISSHILGEVEAVADRIVLMARGKILAVGTLSEIRSLLSRHPLTVRIACNQPRTLGALLVERGLVNGLSINDSLPTSDGDSRTDDLGSLVVKVERPERFFRSLAGVVSAAAVNVERLEPLDASAEAVFEYLVGGTNVWGEEGTR